MLRASEDSQSDRLRLLLANAQSHCDTVAQQCAARCAVAQAETDKHYAKVRAIVADAEREKEAAAAAAAAAAEEKHRAQEAERLAELAHQHAIEQQRLAEVSKADEARRVSDLERAHQAKEMESKTLLERMESIPLIPAPPSRPADISHGHPRLVPAQTPPGAPLHRHAAQQEGGEADNCTDTRRCCYHEWHYH